MFFATSKSEKCRKTEVFGALPIFNLRNISRIYTLLSHFFEFVLAATQKRHYLALKRPFCLFSRLRFALIRHFPRASSPKSRFLSMWPFSVSVPERPGPVGHNRPITRKTSSLFVRTEKMNKLYYTKLVCLGCPNAVKRKSTSLPPMRSIIARAGWNQALVNYSVSSLLGGSSSRYLSSSDHAINPSTLE